MRFLMCNLEGVQKFEWHNYYETFCVYLVTRKIQVRINFISYSSCCIHTQIYEAIVGGATIYLIEKHFELTNSDASIFL